MKAVVYERYGAPEVLRFEEIEQPVPRGDEVLIRVAAVSLNTSDWECLRGKPLYARIFGLLRPKHRVLGSDVAGTVVAVGPEVSELQVGDEVFGDTMGTFGGMAEFACASEKVLMKKPSTLSFEEIATIPQAAIIALQGLRQRGELQKGQKVLINGAGGGSGMFAVQIAKMSGAEVTGVDNEEKLEHMRAIGADHVLNYREVDYTKTGDRYDLIVDLVGTRSVFAHRRALRPEGCYTMVGGTMNSMLQNLILGPIVGFFTGTQIGILAANPNFVDFSTIIELLESGKVKLSIDRRFPLSEAAQALSYLGEGHALGKVIITI